MELRVRVQQWHKILQMLVNFVVIFVVSSGRLRRAVTESWGQGRAIGRERAAGRPSETAPAASEELDSGP